MVHRCAIKDCKNQSNNNIVLHRFPISTSIKKQWISKCKLLNQNTTNLRICSSHFTDADYNRDLKNELLNLPLRKQLKVTLFINDYDNYKTFIPFLFKTKIDSVPSIFSWTTKQQKTDRNKRFEKKKQSEFVNTILTTSALLSSISDMRYADETINLDLNNCSSCDIFREEIRLFKEKIDNQSMEIKKLKLQSTTRFKHLKSLSRSIANVFTRSQIKKLKGQSRVNWSCFDIVSALSFRCLGRKAYETARTILKYPLPSISTLQNWVKHYKCGTGILKDILLICKRKCSKSDELSKIAILSFDEIGIDPKVVYDVTFDTIRSHGKVQVGMLRGLFSSWKQPIYYDYDTPLSKKLIIEVIEEIEKSGIKVYGIVTDMDGTNRRAIWNEMGITMSNVNFTNPADQKRNVFVFSDVPHCLKLFRNHLIDDGLVLPNGTKITIETLEELLQNNGEELKLCPKFTQDILDVKGRDRMRVYPAANLLSGHVSTLALKVFPEKPEISNFFKIINNGFDTLNSRVKVDTKNKLISGYGLYLNDQIEALNQLEELILGIKFLTKKKKNPKKSLLPFQIGFVISIRSTKSLYQDLFQKYKCEYFLTCHLNQDILENFFSQIRSFCGASTIPTCTEFRYRFRMAILGCRVRPAKGSNVQSDEEIQEYFSTELIKMNKLTFISPEPELEFNDKDINLQILQDNFYGNETTEDSLNYLSGYIAWKLKKKGKGTFGIPGKIKSQNHHDLESRTWISLISDGGLLVPGEEITSAVSICEQIFNSYYEEYKSNNLSLNLKSKILQIHPSLNQNILNEFVNIRIKIKVKYLNESSNNESSESESDNEVKMIED